MIRRAATFGGSACNCGCGGVPSPTGMGGFFSTVLDVAGSFVGDPGLGNQVASQSPYAFGPITQTPDQIAVTVLPDARTAMANLAAINVKILTPASQQLAQAVLPQTAAQLVAAGVVFPPGSVGANLAKPTVLDAFGGQDAQWVLIGGLALGALLLLKEL